MDLIRLAKLFGGQGTPIDGCSLSAKEAALSAQEKYAPRPYCLVSDWTILDLEVNSDELMALHTRGLEPVLVYAPCVVLDSRGRYQPGDWVRTSFQIGFESSGFFLTKNTVYVLLGRGNRQWITIDDLDALVGQ